MTFKPTVSDRRLSRVAWLSIFSLIFLCTSLSDRIFAQTVDWAEAVRAAKKEGKLVVHGASEVGILFGRDFQKAYPNIKVVTLSAGRGSVRIQRIMAERRARIYNVDIYIGSPTDVAKTLIPAKAVEP